MPASRPGQAGCARGYGVAVQSTLTSEGRACSLGARDMLQLGCARYLVDLDCNVLETGPPRHAHLERPSAATSTGVPSTSARNPGGRGPDQRAQVCACGRAGDLEQRLLGNRLGLVRALA